MTGDEEAIDTMLRIVTALLRQRASALIEAGERQPQYAELIEEYIARKLLRVIARKV